MSSLSAKTAAANIERVWTPIPNSSQSLALDTRCDVTLYCGSRGPGKTDCQLMRFRKNVGVGYGEFWRGVIFDRAYKNLDDLISKSKRWFAAFDDGAKFLSGNSSLKWVWPTGEELMFRAVKREGDYWDYHGQEFPFIGWNELTKFPTPVLYEKLKSCNRSSWTQEKDSPKDANGKPLLPPIPLEIFATTNPSGPGHIWVKRQFIDPVPYGKVLKTSSTVFNPGTQQDEVVTLKQVAIFGSYKENIYLDRKYVATLDAITDPNLRRAWLEGDWDIVSGGAFDDLWQKGVHILPRFVVPANWRIDRAMDWGSTHPFSVGWFATANGEEVILPGGRVFAPPPGTLIQIAELYGTEQIGTNTGLRMGSTDIALLIKAKEKQLRDNGWIVGPVWAGPADNQINNVNDVSNDTIQSLMAKEGITWTASDKSAGSRKVGLQLMRDRLSASVRQEGPGIYYMDNCRASITLTPILPRDEDVPDDIDTDSEDHVWDMTRYRLLAGSNSFATIIDMRFG